MILLRLFVLSLAMITTASAAEGVILLHGLARTSQSLTKLEAALTAEGYTVLNVNYPSRTAGISNLSQRAISTALSDPRISACSKVHFVTHSLGGILVRDYVARTPIDRMGRVVMLGPPNKGSEVVDKLRSWWLFRVVNGPAGRELGTDGSSVPNTLGPVRFELGVIAGDRSINWINSLMIPGSDDGKVSVAHTKVDGMRDHAVMHVTHPLMMKDRQVIAACIRFLKSGCFESARPNKSLEPKATAVTPTAEATAAPAAAVAQH